MYKVTFQFEDGSSVEAFAADGEKPDRGEAF